MVEMSFFSCTRAVVPTVGALCAMGALEALSERRSGWRKSPSRPVFLKERTPVFSGHSKIIRIAITPIISLCWFELCFFVVFEFFCFLWGFMHLFDVATRLFGLFHMLIYICLCCLVSCISNACSTSCLFFRDVFQNSKLSEQSQEKP